MTASLHGKKIIFLGNSYTFYGNTVIHKGYKVLTQAERSNDPGYFYQLCKAKGMEVAVTNWTFGSHNLTEFFREEGCNAQRDCQGHRHQDYLEDAYFDYVSLQLWREPEYKGDLLEHLRPAMEFFRKANPKVQFLLLIPHMIHEKKEIWLPDVHQLEQAGFLIVDWGRLLYDLSEGTVTVPGGTMTLRRSSFVNAKDNHHENPLAGYLTTLMAYCAITGESAVGQPYDFCWNKDLHKKFDLEAFRKNNYPDGAETNFIEVFHSPRDMLGLQQLADQYLAERKP